MPLNVAFQMDPIQKIDIRGDSTFALLLEGQKRGHRQSVYTPNQLTYREGKVIAHTQGVTVRDEVGNHADLSNTQTVELNTYDAVFLRQDPPFDMNYITSTHLLELVHPKTFVLNAPHQVRNAPEKIMVLNYADLMPPTMVTRNPDDVKHFRSEYKDIIIKPLYGNGGAGIFRIKEDDNNFNPLIETFLAITPEPFMVQQYRSEISEGDKRIILVDGEIAGAINRIPASGETRSNMHVGGQATDTKISDREREICDRLSADLKRLDLVFTGIDVIGGLLTEINVTSPTGIREVERFTGVNIAAKIWDALEQKVAAKS